MRTVKDALRTCPTCGREAGDSDEGSPLLGLRDYRWISQHLPGKVSFTDGDAILERKGNILMLELKPAGQAIPLGQKITLKAFVRKGVHVWVVWDQGDYDKPGGPHVEVGEMDRAGNIKFVQRVPIRALVRAIETWWKDADEGNL